MACGVFPRFTLLCSSHWTHSGVQRSSPILTLNQACSRQSRANKYVRIRSIQYEEQPLMFTIRSSRMFLNVSALFRIFEPATFHSLISTSAFLLCDVHRWAPRPVKPGSFTLSCSMQDDVLVQTKRGSVVSNPWDEQGTAGFGTVFPIFAYPTPWKMYGMCTTDMLLMVQYLSAVIRKRTLIPLSWHLSLVFEPDPSIDTVNEKGQGRHSHPIKTWDPSAYLFPSLFAFPTASPLPPITSLGFLRYRPYLSY